MIFTKRFLPLLSTLFLGALNDNLFKTALVMMITFRFAQESALPPEILVAMAGGIFIFPFFLFSATAGQLADKHDKAKIAQYVKIAEICLMAIAAVGFYLHNIPLLMTVLFGMGVHSAFFGPVKYAILPQHLTPDELLSGNAWVEAATFLAILLGTVLGGMLAMHPEAEKAAALGTIVAAICGYVCSRFIPTAPGRAPDIDISFNIFTSLGRTLARLEKNAPLFYLSAAISWFWFLGAVYLSLFPGFAKNVLMQGEEFVTSMLTLFSFGIGCGSFFCAKFLKKDDRMLSVPVAAFGMGVFGFLLYATQKSEWVLTFLFMISFCGGVFAVPLYTRLQRLADATDIARTIAGLNIMNAMFMVISSLFIMALLKMSWTIPQIFLLAAAFNIPVALLLMPRHHKP